MRRVLAAIAASMMAAGAFMLLPGTASAKTTRPTVSVIQVSGLLDRVQADFWEHAIHDSDRKGDNALVVQLDSNRSVLSDKRFVELEDAITSAKTPVAIWVGPARSASVGGEVRELLGVATVWGLAPGAKFASSPIPATWSELKAQPFSPAFRSPTLGDFILDIDKHPDIEIPSKVVDPKSKTRQREPLVEVSFAKPGLTARTIHGVTSPGPAYALFVLGLLLALLEFASAGVGMAAGTAAIMLVIACLGLGGLPVSGPAIGALIFAVFAFAIDLQAGAPRFWTAIGTGTMLFGSLTLYQDGMHVPLLWIIAVFGLTAAFVFAGLPSLVRARFSSPTIGREGFVGELGAAVGELHPDGIVNVRGATWRARTNRATPINDGDVVRVIGIDGLVLDVEPEIGGAKDHRERSKASK